ncbi:phosphoglycerate mutase-like protein [Rhizodiscina lignyota]|uniref:Phosphoglycerate mutase-like protein n=1 Tax=Rhizodiscina lignyota TaxID=1504668 RepID=A0A9P4ICK6_9PEZI|nr:phosphoglycerate mutase-like protein [Rhizodiscina lignyota]
MLGSIATFALFSVASASPQWGWWPGYKPEPHGHGHGSHSAIITDLSVIQQYWGQITPYHDNTEDHFGIKDVGLPDGCQVEQAHSLQRHAQRFPTSTFDDGGNDEHFAAKLANFTKAHPSKKFTGPLEFLNTYQYIMSESLLTGIGAQTEFQAGVAFWNRYGRTLYNATLGQLAYNASNPDGTKRKKPVLRTTSQSRIWNSQINWALGFFGPSFEATPDPKISDAESGFNVVVIPEGGTENNTLASYDSCANDNTDPIVALGDDDLEGYVAIYLKDATERLQKYAPSGFKFTVNDTYAFQSICAYETAYIGQSDFCDFFTVEEWTGFENTLDIEYYYDYSYGNPTGRSQGIGYLQELIARLTNKLITVSESSINTTITDNAKDFPLGEKFYNDLTHDDIIVSVLTAMSFDYFKDAPSLTKFPPNPDRHFILSNMTPFGGRLITEVIGCASANPKPFPNHRTYYTPMQYGYDPSNAPHKFLRFRLNNGILPVSTIRGGACGKRSDGLCTLSDFLESQKDADKLANYQFSCFGNYTIKFPNGGKDFDGTISA